MYRKLIILRNVNIIDIKQLDQKKIYKIRIRYRMQENNCRIKLTNNNKAVLRLLEPVAMVAKGQTAVLYEKERVIGGGFIEYSE